MFTRSDGGHSGHKSGHKFGTNTNGNSVDVHKVRWGAQWTHIWYKYKWKQCRCSPTVFVPTVIVFVPTIIFCAHRFCSRRNWYLICTPGCLPRGGHDANCSQQPIRLHHLARASSMRTCLLASCHRPIRIVGTKSSSNQNSWAHFWMWWAHFWMWWAQNLARAYSESQ